MAHLLEQVLVADGHAVVLMELRAPLRHKRRDFGVTTFKELLHSNLDTTTRKTLVVAMPKNM